MEFLIPQKYGGSQGLLKMSSKGLWICSWKGVGYFEVL